LSSGAGTKLVAATSLHLKSGGAADLDVGGSVTLQTGQAGTLGIGTLLDARVEGSAKPRRRLAGSEAHRTAILEAGGPLNLNGAVTNFD
jgi:hypothetical protein